MLKLVLGIIIGALLIANIAAFNFSVDYFGSTNVFMDGVVLYAIISTLITYLFLLARNGRFVILFLGILISLISFYAYLEIEMSWFENMIEKLHISLRIGNKNQSPSFKKNVFVIHQYFSSGPFLPEDQKHKSTTAFILGFGDEYPIIVNVAKIREVIMGEKWGHDFTGKFTASIQKEGF